jgi:asparagine synthase (glutamine-hydrolysing)
MTARIAHRGPDDEGYFETTTQDGSRYVGLGHRRLSIIDLNTGHQPIASEDGALQIVFNGEIYNFKSLREQLISLGYRFRTATDTEVVLYAYEEFGARCVERLRGMFAFAIWDSRKEQLFLARDRFGKKPLFLVEIDGLLLFASEIKSLLQHSRVTAQVNRSALWDYFAYRYVPGPATLFSGIRKLRPGAVATWRDGRIEETVYYEPPDKLVRQAGRVPPDVVAEFLKRLEDTVAVRMMSDVPFGAFLSGGIDSSAVVAFMARHSSLPVKTFSVGFAESDYSELKYARVIARQLRTDHHELTVTDRELQEQLPKLIEYRDAPVAEPSDIPIYLLSVEARRVVKMVLTGEGSDEILGGYPKHVFERFVAPYQRLPAIVRDKLIAPLVAALPYRFRRIKTLAANLSLTEPAERWPRWFGALSNRERSRLVALPGPVDRVGVDVQFDLDGRNSPLRRILYFDQRSWLPDNLLERGDRMTMAASLEARMPFLDHELAAFVSSLPDRCRVRGMQTKWILRDGMKQLLPRAILSRPKIGFRVPVNEWFQGSMRDYLYDHLRGSYSLTREYYNKKELDTILDEHVLGRQNHEKTLWCLLNLELWHRCFIRA